MKTHGKSRTKLYGVWSSMRSRCNNPATAFYALYGGRGISVCAAWDDYRVFEEWAMAMGYGPSLTIDRIDNDGDYEPSNCRWVERSEQSRNRSSVHQVTAFGETKCVAEWAQDERCVVGYATLYKRIVQRDWDPIRALTQPNRNRFAGSNT